MGSIFGKAKRGFGKALKPRGPGVLRPTNRQVWSTNETKTN